MNLESTLAKLLEAWQDDGLPEAEEAALLQQLESDAELRRRFAEQVAVLGAVRAAAEGNPRWLALFDLMEGARNPVDTTQPSFEAVTMRRIAMRPSAKRATSPPPRHRTSYRFSEMMALAAAVALLLTGAFLLKSRDARNPDETVSSPPAPEVAAVAVVVAVSPESQQVAGTYLKPGSISQAEGWLTLQTLNGVSVTLDAPFQADLLAIDSVRLTKGRARVRVPDGAQGFRLDSPAFDVVDLGTEFAALVNADGTGTCRVFEGKADVSLLDSIGEVKRTQRLTANKSVRVDPSIQDMRMIEESNDDYPEIKQPLRPTLALTPTYRDEVMAMQPAAYWRFEEIRDNREVTNEVTGARMVAIGTAALAPEGGGNHSGELTRRTQAEYFQIPNWNDSTLDGDFSIGLFVQFEWLQNFALVSVTRYDKIIQGNSFILQSYASFRRSGLNGTGLHAVLRDPPTWDGGVEVYGNSLLRPLHWHHIAAVRKGDQLGLYLDGVVVGRESAGAMPLDWRQIFVGRLNGNASQSRTEARGLVGHVDELTVFPRALTDAQIQKLAEKAK